MQIKMNGNPYAKHALILPLLKNVMIVIKYAEANFLPVGRVIKPIFAMIVLRFIAMMMEKNYVLRVSQAKDENEKKRERAYREEYIKRKAEHRRNWPHLFTGE